MLHVGQNTQEYIDWAFYLNTAFLKATKHLLFDQHKLQLHYSELPIEIMKTENFALSVGMIDATRSHLISGIPHRI